MPIQAPQWTEFLSCPVCYNVFNEKQHRPISLACGHTVCKSCLSKLQQRKCPFDQSLISRDINDLPVNFALLQLVCATAVPDDKEGAIPKECRKHYEEAKTFIEELALLLKPVSSVSTGSIITPSSSSSTASNSAANCVLSRPMQRKLITLVNCQLVEEEGRSRAVRAARSLGERTVTELILQHQNPQQLSSNLWAAVRGRGCQFLGPAMQEEVLHLILLALEDGSQLSRKVLVLFVVQRLESQYPQASKTAIGHVVQLLYRASCFKVTKRDSESSLMQLKEEYRSYETLRREHDTQIVQIAMEAGLRIAPDQWSSLLYGDSTHKSHMQSIIDKLQTPQTFAQSVSELLIALQRTGDPHSLQRLRPQLEFLSSIDPSPDVPCPSWENLEGVLRAAKTVVEGLVTFLQNSGHKKHDFLTPFNNVRYKTSMCRDYGEKGSCPRGSSCTFAHSEEELERYRQKNKKAAKGAAGGQIGATGGHGTAPHVGKAAAVPQYKQQRDAQSHRSSDSEEGAYNLVEPFHSFNMEETSPQGATARPQGATGYGPVVAAVLPNSHHPNHMSPSQQPPQTAQVPPANLQPMYQRPPPQPGYQGQSPQQGYQAQVPPPLQGYPQGQPCLQGIQGQVPPQHGRMPPPMVPPPQYDLMGYPGAGMVQGKYPLPPPMNPMMYMYPGMPPCMSYYHPGYMPQGGMRYPCEGYRPQLNPYAEPWSPHSQQQFSHDFIAMTGQQPVEAVPQVDCTVCSQRRQQNTAVTASQFSQNDLNPSNTVTMAAVAQVTSTTEAYQVAHTQQENMTLSTAVTTADALISRQSLSTLQDRRNSLLAIMKERQKNPDLSTDGGSAGMKSYKDLIERMKQHHSGFSSGLDQREKTLEHPLPRDSGPPGLRSSEANKANLFKRLGALSGMPPRSVNDSIMASWMTSALTASNTKNNNSAITIHSSVLDFPQPGESSSYLDVISSTSDIAWSSSPTLDELVASSSKVKESVSSESNWSAVEEDYPYLNDVSRTIDSPSPTPLAAVSSLNHADSALSSYNHLDANPIVSSLSHTIFSSLNYSNFSSLGLNEQEQEDVIPFDPPIISKFGPISRNKLTKSNNTVPLKVTADEMMRTIPVTAVTPLSRPPLPNAATVPSRFTPSSKPVLLDSVNSTLSGSYEPEPYSLWNKEVVQLEQKAQEASTEDERLSVELQAVEIQISLKQQELQEAHDVQRVQRQASEYMKQQKLQREDNIQHPVDRSYPGRYDQQN